MTSALQLPSGNPDPREFAYVSVRNLRVDERKQRDVDPEKIAKIANEFDWTRFEALTVARTKQPDVYDVVEGQHRTLGAADFDPDLKVPCMILPPRTSDKTQSQIALDIVQGRRGHSAYEQWRLRYNSGHPHEVYATTTLDKHGIRLGKHPSAATIGAVATVRRIVHGGQFTPEYGAALLDGVLTVIKEAFPTHDHESNVSRWDRFLLLAVAGILHSHPDCDHIRLVTCIRVRPASQWVNFGKGADAQTADEAIRQSIISEYNRGRRRGRL